MQSFQIYALKIGRFFLFDRYRKCKKSSNRASKINIFGRGPPVIEPPVIGPPVIELLQTVQFK